MLQRVYGTAWNTKSELKSYLDNREQAKERDHRKIGREQGLFMISKEVGQGLPIWLPKGAIIRREIEQFVVELEQKFDYEHIYSPHKIGRASCRERV